jgi:hypothetical protein
MRNNRVINTGSIGHVQDAAGDDDGGDFDLNDFMSGLTGGTGGVVNTGTTGNVQNQSGSGTGNTQNINYRRT